MEDINNQFAFHKHLNLEYARQNERLADGAGLLNGSPSKSSKIAVSNYFSPQTLISFTEEACGGVTAEEIARDESSREQVKMLQQQFKINR